jgi:hypothetical protein
MFQVILRHAACDKFIFEMSLVRDPLYPSRIYCHVSQWLRRGFGVVIGFIGYLQVVTTNNYNTIADLHNLQSLQTYVLSLSALVLADL